MAEGSSGTLRGWLAESREADYVRLLGYWMGRATRGPAEDYRADPGLTGQPLVDALVAAAVEHVAIARREDPPAWVNQPERFLDSIWHPGLHAMLPWSLAHAPGAFKVRGLMIEADSLRVA